MANNGYLHNVDRRINRRKNRVRNQIIAYITLGILLIALVVGVILAVKNVKKLLNGDKPGQFASEEMIAEEAAGESTMPEVDLVTPEDVIEITTPSKEELLDEVVYSCISAMGIRDKVAGLFIVTPEQITGVETVARAGDGTKEAMEKYPVGGIVYFEKNIMSEDQITEMVANTISYSKYPLFIAIDEEVGDVTRLRKALKLNSIDNAAAIGGMNDANIAYESYRRISEYMTQYGFNLDFAPVADILLNSNNTSIGNRAFGANSDIVSKMVESSVKGLLENDVTACVKHFPGQGAVDADAHNGIAITNRTAEEIRNNELIPFVKAIEAGAQMVMVGNFVAPALTGDETTPCTLSKEVMTDLLRGECHYNGVIITDAMNMGAIKEYYGADEAAVRAIKAGADMILMPEDFEMAYEAVVAAVEDGTISEQRIDDSLARVYRIKYRNAVQ